MADGPAAAYLAEVRDRHELVNGPEAGNWGRIDDLHAASLELSHRDAGCLLAAAEAALGHHVRAVIEDTRPPFPYCRTCSGHPAWPCPEVRDITAALLGEEAPADVT